jgi:hypothetical protein
VKWKGWDMGDNKTTELGEGIVYMTLDGVEYEFQLKDVELCKTIEATADDIIASSKFDDNGFNANCEFAIDMGKWRNYKMWFDIIGVDYKKLKFRYKVEAFLYFLMDKIKRKVTK